MQQRIKKNHQQKQQQTNKRQRLNLPNDLNKNNKHKNTHTKEIKKGNEKPQAKPTKHAQFTKPTRKPKKSLDNDHIYSLQVLFWFCHS